MRYLICRPVTHVEREATAYHEEVSYPAWDVLRVYQMRDAALAYLKRDWVEEYGHVCIIDHKAQQWQVGEVHKRSGWSWRTLTKHNKARVI